MLLAEGKIQFANVHGLSLSHQVCCGDPHMISRVEKKANISSSVQNIKLLALDDGKECVGLKLHFFL